MQRRENSDGEQDEV